MVDETLVSLKEAGLVRFVHPSHGRSVTRYRQVLEERLGLDVRQLALVAVLLLRGAQTAGELRSRTDRMATFAGTTDLEAELARLAEGAEPLVARLPRRPGQKEERWTQLLMEVGEELPAERADWVDALDASSGAGRSPAPWAAEAPTGLSAVVPLGGVPSVSPPGLPSVPPPGLPSAGAEVALLEARVVELRAEVLDLRSEVSDLRGEVIDLRAALEHLEAQLGGA